MWSVVVALPAVQAEFHAERGAASLPFTLTMIGFGVGGVIMGRLADRRGIVLPVMIGAGSLGAGFVLASLSGGLWSFSAAYLLIGTFGTAATFAPLMADISLWFERGGVSPSPCAPPATTSPAPFGRRSSNRQSEPMAGAPPIWRSACSASLRCRRWRSCCAAARQPEPPEPQHRPRPAAR